MSSTETTIKKTTKKSVSKKKTNKKKGVSITEPEIENVVEIPNVDTEVSTTKVKKVTKKTSKKVSKKKSTVEVINNTSSEHSNIVSEEIKHSPNKFIKMDLELSNSNANNKIIIDDNDLNLKVEEMNKKINNYIMEISDLKLTIQKLEDRLNRILNQLVKPNTIENLDINTELSEILNTNV